MKQHYVLPPLPFATEEVKDFCSAEQIEFHYEKHHKAYVEKTNDLLREQGDAMSDLGVEELVRKADGKLFENVSQHWNHTFLWHSLTSAKNGKSSLPAMESALGGSFDSVEGSRDKFVELGRDHFGSGWLWLGMHSDKDRELEWIDLHDGDSPLKQDWVPLLCMDLWEHAYYIDYRNQRERYLRKAFEHLNWSFALENLRAGKAPDFNRVMLNESGLTQFESVRRAG